MRAISSTANAAALIQGQPYGIWYPAVLCGVVFCGVTLGLIPVLRRRYAEAEQRLMEAADLRAS